MLNDKMTIAAPCNGEVIKIEKVDDPLFSGKLMGDGFAIVPTSDDFIVPVSGEMTTVFDTKHAYGIKNEYVEVLVHIGLDTVNLNGEGFTSHVSQGDKVVQGEKMCIVDIKAVSAAAPSIQTAVIITNKVAFEIIKTGVVKAGEIIAKLKKE